jgi:hypothetical protein
LDRRGRGGGAYRGGVTAALVVHCSNCWDDTLPWWLNVACVVVGCLLAYGLLCGVVWLVDRPKRRSARAVPGSPVDARAPGSARPPVVAGPPAATGPPVVAGPPGLARPPGGTPATGGGLVTVSVNRAERYALETQPATGRCFLSIPVANRMADYSEFYEIDRDTFERFRLDPASAMPFVWQCRRREVDHLLAGGPAPDRGTSGFPGAP